MTDGGSAAARTKQPRIFLVVVDETEEMSTALRYACRRAQRTAGRVALLHVIEPAEFQHWLGVGEVMAEERREEAERLLQRGASEVFALTGNLACIHIREGRRRDELMQLMKEDLSISIVVLATSTSGSDPGPLVSHLVAQMGAKVRTPVALVPGDLSPEEIDVLA